MIGFIKRAAVAAVLAVAPAAVAVGQVQVDKNLATYKPAEGVSGSVKSVGSDTLNNLMTGWAEEFHKFYPNVQIEIEGKGSGTAPPALIAGTAQFGPMSREMKASEVDEFKKKHGYAPTAVRVAVDSLGVFVNKDNPVKALSVEQLRQVFSVEGKDMTWGDVGATDAEWKDKPISLYGRNSASGTYGFFKEHVLGNKDYKPSVKEQPGSSAVVQAVASDKFGIGYSGIGYATADVRAVAVSAKGKKAFEPNAENAYAGDYPITRFLLVYVNVKPGGEPTPLVREFVRLVVSQQGQQITVRDGFYPIPKRVADQGLTAVGVKPEAAAAAK